MDRRTEKQTDSLKEKATKHLTIMYLFVCDVRKDVISVANLEDDIFQIGRRIRQDIAVQNVVGITLVKAHHLQCK